MDKGNVKVLVSTEMRQLLKHVGDDIVMKMDLGSYASDGHYVSGDEYKPDNGDVFSFMQWVITEKAAAGKWRTADNYRAALHRLYEFWIQEGREESRREGELVPDGQAVDDSNSLSMEVHDSAMRWRDITVRFVERFELHLLARGVKKNTSSFYLRIFRALCNRARRAGHGVGYGLFDTVYTGKAKTRKRAVPMDIIRLIAHAETNGDREAFARDLFLFSFITRGMSMVDIAHLQRSDINSGRLSYRRRKTGQQLAMEWLDEMQRIVTLYNKGSRHVFPIITCDGEEGYKEYQKLQNGVNYSLRQLGKRLGIGNLTMYVARHSWATIAKSTGVPTVVISDALGHDSERTTQIYLASVDEGRIDAANRDMVARLLTT